MKISKLRLTESIICIFIFACSILFAILNEYVFNNTLQTISSFVLFCLINTLGIGLAELIFAFLKKSVITFFISSIALIIGITLLLIYVCQLIWWIILACDIFVALIITFCSIVTLGNKTEGIALNKKPEYKNYEQRKAEKIQQEENEEKEPLPTLKSFSNNDK